MEKSTHPETLFEGKKTSPILKSISQYSHLKNLYRRGWLRHIPKEKVETQADHSWGVAMLSYILAKELRPELNADKVLKLAVLHEIDEVYTEDITPYDNITKEERAKKEQEAINKIFTNLKIAEEIKETWNEINKKSTPEGSFVKDIDRLEMCYQALIYELQHDVEMPEFYTYSRERITDPKLLELLDEIESLRPKNLKK